MEWVLWNVTSDFNLFSDELEANLSTFDPVGEAEAKLEGLHMQENHQAMKYFIKNEMVHHEKPTTLSGLRRLVQATNARYWERKAEIACETPTNSSGQKSEKNNNNK